MPSEVSAQSIINLPREAAWEKLRDISLAHHYVPGLIKTEIITPEKEGVGASRYVYRSETSYLQETVEEWTEGEGFLIRLHKGEKSAPPFKEAWFRYHLEDASPDTTRFIPSMTYQLPWGMFGDWMGKRLENFVSATLLDVALSMKLYYETGEPTSAEALKAIKAAHKNG